MSRAGGHLGRGTARPGCGWCACRGLAGCQRQCRGARLAPRRLSGSSGIAGAYKVPGRPVGTLLPYRAAPASARCRGARGRQGGHCGKRVRRTTYAGRHPGAGLSKRRARREYAAALGGSEVDKRGGGGARQPNSPAGTSAGRAGPRQHRQRRAAFRQTSQGPRPAAQGPANTLVVPASAGRKFVTAV